MDRGLEKKESGVSKIHFEVVSKLEVKIRTTEEYWNIITKIKHPILTGKEKSVQDVLQNPAFVRRSKRDKHVYLFYKKFRKHYLVVVVRHMSKKEGFIITSYITDAIKEGIQIWPKQPTKVK